MGESGSVSAGNLIREFLKSPLKRKYFDDFFQLCYQNTLGYLRYLKSKGYRISLGDTAETKSISDTAYDILGGFLQTGNNYPFFIIFDYFARHGISDFEKTDSDELYDHYKILLFGYIRKELWHLHKKENPQVDNLKRRFNDILNSPDYITFTGKDRKTKFVCFKSHNEPQDGTKQILTRDDILPLAEEAYLSSKNRREWCRKIFELIDQMADYQNCINKYELIKVIVAVNMKYVELDALSPAKLPTLKATVLKRIIIKTKDQTLIWLKETVMDKYIEKGDLSRDEARLFLSASDMYLSDLAYSGETDPIPVYFRETMPENTHARYLKDYKYLFETVFSRAVEDFRKRLKNNSTIRKLGYYFKDE